MGGAEWFWVMIISCSAMWAFVAIVRTIVDGVVRLRQQRMEIEREYLAQMMAEIEEIKQRLDVPHREETSA